MDIRGKIALVTGGARIGQAVAKALAAAGCRVAATYRASRAAAEAVPGAWAVRADLARAGEADRVVEAVLRKWGGVDILVHMASVYGKTPPAKAVPLSAGPGAVDLEAAHRLALRCAPVMVRRGGGRIVLFSDWTAAGGRPRYKGYIPYYAAKAGVKALAEALALELAPRVLVNAVAPGPILPPAGLSAAEDRAVRAATPLGRWGGPEEIVKAVLFFLESDFVTGECLRVDGGRHLL